MSQQETISEKFFTGQKGVDSVARPLVNPGYSPQMAYKGVKVRAQTSNAIDVYLGQSDVTVNDGFALGKGESIDVLTTDPSSIYLVATPAGNTEQVVTVDAEEGTFTLSNGETETDPIAYDATAATVETALETIFGEDNVSVSGDAGGPWTVEFVEDLAKTDVESMSGTASAGTISVATTLASAGSRVSWYVQ